MNRLFKCLKMFQINEIFWAKDVKLDDLLEETSDVIKHPVI